MDDDSITIGDDRGFPDAPGLNADQTAAVINFIDKCNELGGINGRQIEYNNYDAAIFNAGAIMQEACDQVLMLVGNGFSLDQFTEQTRVGCGLGAVPAWTVSVDFAHGPWQVNAVPNPCDQTPMSMAVHAAQIAEARGYDITKAGAMYGDSPATQETWLKVQDTYPEYGFEFVEALEYATGGEDDWTPFIQQLKDAGVEVVYFTGSCPNHYQAVRETAVLNDFDAIWFTDANFYVTSCSTVNESGSLGRLSSAWSSSHLKRQTPTLLATLPLVFTALAGGEAVSLLASAAVCPAHLVASRAVAWGCGGLAHRIVIPKILRPAGDIYFHSSFRCARFGVGLMAGR